MAKPASYSHYAVGVLDIIKDIFVYPDTYQTWNMAIALSDNANNRVLTCFSEKTRTRAGTEFQCSINGSNEAFASTFADFRSSFDAFSRNTMFLAWNGRSLPAEQSRPGDLEKRLSANYTAPLASVRLMFRKKGSPKKQTQIMRFMGFPDANAAMQYALDLQGDGLDLLVTDGERPLNTPSLHEWK